MKHLFNDDKLGFVRNVGYPNPNKSHFRSTDIWNSASASDEFIFSGWFGRYLSNNHSSYPEGYPNNEYPDPLALTIGRTASNTCQGPIVNMGMSIKNLNSLTYFTSFLIGFFVEIDFFKKLDLSQKTIHFGSLATLS